MSSNIAEKIIKPERCVLAFGIPLTKEEFFEDQHHPQKGFAKKYRGFWNWYEEDILAHYAYFAPRIHRTGVPLYPAVTFAQFTTFCRADQDVVVLFSHWEQEAIEFADRLVDYQEIVTAIPASFDRVLDLAVCSPALLEESLRRERPHCLVRGIKPHSAVPTQVTGRRQDELLPRYWLAFYFALFTHLKTRDLTYLQAVKDVVEGFQEKAWRN